MTELAFIIGALVGGFLGYGFFAMRHFANVNRRPRDERGTQQPTYDSDGNFTGWKP